MVDYDMQDPDSNTYGQTHSASTATNDTAPSWVAGIIILLMQFLRTLQAERQNTVAIEARPSHSQPHTENFSGNDVSEYPQFRSLLESKLQIDARAIGSEEER
ncbi:hypothetical protein EPUL_006757, partial [Erysiphe pulchra]